MLIDEVRTTIDKEQMTAAGDTVLVGVSGGLDSVVLLDLLVRLQSELQISLVVAHLDHALRPDSEEDSRFVERLASSYGVAFETERLTSDAIASLDHLGPEGGVRVLRLEFLERTAIRVGASRVAMAHHADDRAETVLYRLARGTGPEGLAGIRPTRGIFIRPLIGSTRAEILAYAERRKLRWRDDESNDDLQFARNRVRHRVLPELERVHPRATEAICRAAELLSEHREALDYFVSRVLDEASRPTDGDWHVLDGPTLQTYPEVVQSLILRETLRGVRGDLEGIDHGHIHALRRLADSRAAHEELHLPRCIARRQMDRLLLTALPPVDEPEWSIPIPLGRTDVPEHGFAVKLQLYEHGDRPTEMTDRFVEYADADRIAFPLTIRNRRPGDRFEPLGMPNLKLKDFFINQHVPYYDRPRIPLLCDRNRIVWVAGVRLSNAVRCDRSTHRLLRMQMEVMS